MTFFNIKENPGMKMNYSKVKKKLLFLLVLFVFFGCEISPEKAREKLGKMSVQYSGESFAQSIENNDILVVKLFLQAKMDPERKLFIIEGEEILPLSYAAINNSIDVAKLLIEKGADVNATTEDGCSALMGAAWANSLEIAKILIGKGADVSAIDNRGSTVLDYVVDQNSKIAELLKKKGAKVSQRRLENLNKSQLSALRDALSICYGCLEGNWPATLAEITPTYIQEIPVANLGDDTNSNHVVIEKNGNRRFNGDGKGGWWYNSGRINPEGKFAGNICINSKKKDIDGKYIYEW